jgi:hypothetical protein
VQGALEESADPIQRKSREVTLRASAHLAEDSNKAETIGDISWKQSDARAGSNKRGKSMKSLLVRLFTAPRKPVFAPDYDAGRAMRIAEIKWLLSEISAPSDRR